MMSYGRDEQVLRAQRVGVVTRSFALGTLLLTIPSGVAAQPTDYYAGKQLTMIVGTSVGGGYDLNARILAEFLPRYIPGRPTIVVQNRPGASGIAAANHVYNIAAKDGTVIAMCTAAIVLTQVLEPEKVRYKSDGFGWLGTISTLTSVLGVFKETRVATIEDAKRTSVVLGASGKGSVFSIEPTIVNALLGTTFKIASGYPGGNEINLAMDRHEVMGRTLQWDNWLSQRPNWIKEGRLNFLIQIGPKVPDRASVPGLSEIVKDPNDLAVVRLLEVLQYAGRSVFTPPNVPEARLSILRRAFDQTVKDPEYIARIRQAELNLYSRTGEETQAYISSVVNGPASAARDFNRIINSH